MTKEQRQMREREEMKKRILEAAALLIAEEGIESFLFAKLQRKSSILRVLFIITFRVKMKLW